MKYQEAAKMKILLLAYMYPPDSSVGTFRPYYWAKNIPRLSQGNMIVDVITATPQNDSFENKGIQYIPPIAKKRLSILKDPGFAWKKAILKNKASWLHCREYDIVIITGGPFLQFSLGRWLKKHTKALVVLDFRDPFFNNPYFKDTFIKHRLKYLLEYSFISYADAIITVNNFCKARLSNENKPVWVVPNGYPDSLLEKKSVYSITENIKIVYAGKLYHYGKNMCTKLIEAKRDDEKFSYIGQNFNDLEQDIQKNVFIYMPCSQTDLFNDYLLESNVGVIFTDGESFQLGTKVFDYAGLNMIILIITEGVTRSGAFGELLENYPHVFWSACSVKSIRAALYEIQNYICQGKHEKNTADTYRFSREYSTRCLIENLNNFWGGSR